MSSDSGIPLRNTFSLRQRHTMEEQNQKLRDAAEMYEKHFLRELVKSMRSTVQEGGFIPTSQAEKIFREQLDEQYVENWEGRGGIGLADLIHQQLLSRYGEQMGLQAPVEKAHGPLVLTRPEGAGPSRIQVHEASPLNSSSVHLLMEDLQGQSFGVVNPWNGVLSGVRRGDPNQSILTVDHSNGLRSELKFQGVLTSSLASKLQTSLEQSGRPLLLSSGEALGVADAGVPLSWNLSRREGP